MSGSYRVRLLDRFNRKRRRYRAVFETPDGQWVLNDLARQVGLAGTPFVPGQPDTSAFNDGQQNVVKAILSTMNVDPDVTVKRVIEELQKNGQDIDD